MKKPLFVAVNSRYNHTNLAIRSIASYCAFHSKRQLSILEASIAEFPTNILRSIYERLKEESDRDFETNQELIIFSVYIWNAPLIYEVANELKKILPRALIGFGGPEVSYQAEKVFFENPSLDFIVKGEGEETVKELVERYYVAQEAGKKCEIETLKDIPGLYLRSPSENIFFTGERELLCTLDSLPFAYPSLEALAKQGGEKELAREAYFDDRLDPDIHIFYYESSRGCPFKCSYCLSSIDKRMRYKSLETVFAELDIFLKAEVRLVKFVDRTFNLNEERYLAIWNYLLENHNGITMFHFEIAAEQFSDRVLDFLQKMPRGIMQFEIGVQSLNPQTLKEIHRHADIQKLSKVLSRIPSTIHSHLDLIAGLPHENLQSFASSFDQTISLKPDMLQLGFLKILSGTEMEIYAQNHSSENGYQWMSKPPYEVLQSPDLSYAELLFLKDIEEVLDLFYNSGIFKTICLYILSKDESLFEFFSSFVFYCRNKAHFKIKHKTQSWAKIISEFFQDIAESSLENSLDNSQENSPENSLENSQENVTANSPENITANSPENITANSPENITANSSHAQFINTKKIDSFISKNKKYLYELLRFDFLRLVKPGKIPSWYKRQYNKDAHHAALLAHTEIKSTRESYAYSDYDRFAINPFSFEIISDEQEKVAILFLYAKPQERTSGQTRSETDCIVLEK